MTSEEWKRVHALFDAASRRDPEERDAFLDGACAGKPWLRAAVASLLAGHPTGGDAVEGRAAQPAIPFDRDPGPGALDGRLVGPYIIRHEIGRGGMGVVYLADDTRLSRRVALKALAPGVARDPGRWDRLRQEARAAAGLSHPGIATVYAFEHIGDEFYLACEYVPGLTLRAALEAGPLPVAQVIDIATQLARALDAAHHQGIVHRDLKPENVVITPAGAAKILDFGIARIEHLTPQRLTQTGTVVGTPAYMAPEQILGQGVDFRIDLFSFGVVVYEMASGSNPFEAGTLPATMARILELVPAPLSEACPSSVPDLDRIVGTCLNKRPPDRYKSTHDLVADLERVYSALSAAPQRMTEGRRPAVPNASRRAGKLTPRWWWEFHQAAIAVIYALMVYPSWRARGWLPRPWGMLFLFAVLASAAAAASLRLHLWFTARFHPAELSVLRARAQPWTHGCDAAFGASLLLGALGIGNGHPEIATLLVTVAVAAAVASYVIEPTTTRAAFRGKSGAFRAPAKPRR